MNDQFNGNGMMELSDDNLEAIAGGGIVQDFWDWAVGNPKATTVLAKKATARELTNAASKRLKRMGAKPVVKRMPAGN